jgi:hypothetical protein
MLLLLYIAYIAYEYSYIASEILYIAHPNLPDALLGKGEFKLPMSGS